MEEYYLVDFNFTPPIAIDRGTFDDCQRTLDECASVHGYGGYKILTKEGYDKARDNGNN